ncbi:type IV pilus assembly protein PilF [Rheinheimera pacifica]|uniref:type IV pilus biogenesis/stability protein PilW n=1 Tax=Rheinheimera pacifica TaxID=173990 RepID=UPI00216A9D17|nr:type IV pilus biogenesis/stability protein PilW [Rheinheimera pacifica]MCS4306926.1 type IV pilus assembly protein PilF [Rheinheimera pacifica]
MLKQKFFIGVTLSSVLILAGCVSEQTYVGSDKPVSDRSFDNIEAARTRISLGLNYLRRGDTSQAKYNLERARSFAPNSAEVYSALAYYYQSVGEEKQAEEYFRQSIQKDANYADAYNNYGAFLCQLHRYDEAEQLLLKAISRPGYIRVAESYENLALCQLQQNNFSKAKSYLDSSVSHNTTRITSLTMAAGLSYAMGDNRAAKNQLDRISRLGRVSARTVLLSYLIAEKSGDRDTMQSAEQLLLTLYTDSPETWLLLQGRLADSEFEQLRERYKDSLMANIVLPDDSAKQQVPAQPVDNPKMKIVKRKTTEADAPVAAVVAQKPVKKAIPAPTAVAPAVDPALPLNNSITAIAGSLTQNNTALTTAAPQPVSLPQETSSAPVQAIVTETVPEPAATANTAVVETSQAEAETASATTAVPASPEISESSAPFHIVKEAESLYAISVQYNIRLSRLMQWNQLTPASVIRAGQKIWLAEVSDEQLQAEQTSSPPAVIRQEISSPYHQVESGETMFAISYRYNIRLDRFLSWNNLTEQSRLKVGQQVYIVDPASIEQ